VILFDSLCSFHSGNFKDNFSFQPKLHSHEEILTNLFFAEEKKDETEPRHSEEIGESSEDCDFRTGH
jgi:hypothetical protein